MELINKAQELGKEPVTGFAFETGIEEKEWFVGIRKRELFAAMAMQGLSPLLANDPTESKIIFKTAVAFADALLEELSK
jgi:hypothetical protein